MRQSLPVALCLCVVAASGGCSKAPGWSGVERASSSVEPIDDGAVNDIMLSVADPNEAAAHFRRSAEAEPGRIDLKRGLAASLVRAERPAQGAQAWSQVVAMPGATPQDRVAFADALIRSGDWPRAEAALAELPAGFESFERVKLEAMIADGNEDWARADTLYERAIALTTSPAGSYNNWGYSKLSRGAPEAAEPLFERAIALDPGLFTAKNNLALARASQGRYDLPVVPMTQVERAQLLHTMALGAIRRGDVSTGEALLREAVATHPQHFDAAARALAALGTDAAG